MIGFPIDSILRGPGPIRAIIYSCVAGNDGGKEPPRFNTRLEKGGASDRSVAKSVVLLGSHYAPNKEQCSGVRPCI